ncbi:MAG: hypothetical protein K0S23_1296 [Fluviicola sp.]|jgi:hypothetical protein|uniref:hypothetical protein n=1 Tax=Fluviicola sp. TaxID=1917219 RepID=UPI0026029A51|nr:hypothetical protein [Fluviicola sp.]MDF3026989.1 hypothetical protein [Fluviicola sp.]
MKIIAGLLILFAFAFRVSGQGQRGQTYVAPWDIPALEDPYFFEPYFDTIYIHDTVYVSDADAFLKKYYKGKITLNELVKNQQILDSILRHLSSVSGKELFYNYFGNHRFPRALSNSISIKEFSLDEDLQFKQRQFNSGVPVAGAVSNELLFRFTGAYRTNRFLTNEEAVVRAISYIFKTLQSDTAQIRSINLYFPDFNFKEKRAMAQFVKSVRMVLNAAKDYDISKMKLKVFFHTQKDPEIIGEDFLYSLMIKASEVVLLNPTNVIDDYYVEGDPFSKDDIENVGLFTRMNSHFYLARFTNGNPEIRDSITDFSVDAIREIALGDIPENNWESYLWFLIGLLVFVILIVLLYLFYPPFSYILNQNMGIVLASAIVFSIEFFMLAGVVFQNMCTEDESTSLNENPSLLFCMPILMVVVLPLMRQFSRNRKLP